MSAVAIELPRITRIDPFPTRKEPQGRYDAKVNTAMNQVSNLPDELNAWSEALEKAGTVIINNTGQNLEYLQDCIAQSKASAEAAKASETGAASSATQAATSAKAAKTSETNAASSAASASSDRTAAASSAAAARASETNARASEANAKLSEARAGQSETASAASRDAASAYAQQARESKDYAQQFTEDLYNLELGVVESADNPGFAILDKERNRLTIGIPAPEPGKTGPTGDITTALDANLIAFEVNADGILMLKYTGDSYTGAKFSINSDGMMEVAL